VPFSREHSARPLSSALHRARFRSDLGLWRAGCGDLKQAVGVRAGGTIIVEKLPQNLRSSLLLVQSRLHCLLDISGFVQTPLHFTMRRALLRRGRRRDAFFDYEDRIWIIGRSVVVVHAHRVCIRASMRAGRTKTTSFSLDKATLKNLKALAARRHAGNVSVLLAEFATREAKFTAAEAFFEKYVVPPLDEQDVARIEAEWRGPVPVRKTKRRAA
jgi:hypothetical protein